MATKSHKILRTKYNFVSIYPHIHKILTHGPSIIMNLQSGDFGPGAYSEQSQEGLNKQIRKIREFNARKTSLIDNLKDIAIKLFCLSDPFINSI